MLRQRRGSAECEQDEAGDERQQSHRRGVQARDEIIAGAGQERQYGGSRQDERVPSAPEKLSD